MSERALMPSLDIATSQTPFRNHLGASRLRPIFHDKPSNICTFKKENKLGFTRKLVIQVPGKVNLYVGHLQMCNTLLVKAVATFETKDLIQSEDGYRQSFNLKLGSNSNSQELQSLSGDSAELDQRERLRRMKISKANKGNIPWNKGRKHTAETLLRIRERTKLAMQDPKVKMKLVNLGHAQSEETRIKIGVGVRMGWQRRRERLMVQETCCLEWQNMIAEASRKGYPGEDELQWDSYKIMDRQLKKEWLESIERRKSMPRPKGSKRAPKSPEQRRKISAAISAKWADPGYRERVCLALSKYHGVPVGGERKRGRKPPGETSSIERTPLKKSASGRNHIARTEGKNHVKTGYKPKRSTAPSYKDPLASSKLEMIKKIRAERASMETKKRETTERAKLLIAEAEKAAKALEVAAMKSPLARASLLETRKLIAEATRSIEGIETGQLTSFDSQNSSSSNPNGLVNYLNEDLEPVNVYLIPEKGVINGTHILSPSNTNYEDFDLNKFALQNLLNDRDRDPTPASPSVERISGEGIHNYALSSSSQPDIAAEQTEATTSLAASTEVHPAPKDEEANTSQARQAGTSPVSSTATKKKWVCGRLVAVEGD